MTTTQDPLSPPTSRRRPRALTPALLLACALALTACTSTGTTTGTGTEPPSPTTPTSPGTTVADPNTVLTQLATELRHHVDTLAAPINATQKWKTDDTASVCGVPNGDWPKQWGYSLTFQLATPDTRALAHQLADQLKAQGWTLREDSRTDLTRIVAQRAGTVIQVQGLPSGGRLGLNAYSACVRADGTIDHTPVT